MSDEDLFDKEFVPDGCDVMSEAEVMKARNAEVERLRSMVSERDDAIARTTVMVDKLMVANAMVCQENERLRSMVEDLVKASRVGLVFLQDPSHSAVSIPMYHGTAMVGRMTATCMLEAVIQKATTMLDSPQESPVRQDHAGGGDSSGEEAVVKPTPASPPAADEFSDGWRLHRDIEGRAVEIGPWYWARGRDKKIRGAGKFATIPDRHQIYFDINGNQYNPSEFSFVKAIQPCF